MTLLPFSGGGERERSARTGFNRDEVILTFAQLAAFATDDVAFFEGPHVVLRVATRLEEPMAVAMRTHRPSRGKESSRETQDFDEDERVVVHRSASSARRS
jgi:hypothetical protein